MYRNILPSRQLSTWLCAALIPVLLQLTAGVGWLAAGIITVACGLTVAAVWKWGRVLNHPIFAGILYLYIIVLLMNLLPHAAAVWPGDNYPAVPLILLALAVWATRKGASAAARVGCVLFWIVLIIYPAVFLSGTQEINLHWLKPSMPENPWIAIPLLLLPCVALLLRKPQDGWNDRLLLPGAFLLAATIMTAGILSSKYANTLPDPFYTATQSISLLGVAQRFEALLSAGMTVGWFSLLSLMLSIAAACAEKMNPRWGSRGLWGAAVLAAAGMLCNLHIIWEIASILAAVFWVAIPLITQGLVREKKL